MTRGMKIEANRQLNHKEIEFLKTDLIGSDLSKKCKVIVKTTNGMAVIFKRRRIFNSLAVSVKKDHRNRGLGTKLVSEALKNVTYCLLTTNPKNEIAIKLYKKVGFRKVGIWRKQGTNMIVMLCISWDNSLTRYLVAGTASSAILWIGLFVFSDIIGFSALLIAWCFAPVQFLFRYSVNKKWVFK